MRTIANNLRVGRSYVLSMLGGRSIWALSDQLLISFTNFLTMILVAKGLGDNSDFGVFALVHSVLLLANIIQFSLITQPHNVLGATRKGDAYRVYTFATLVVQLLLLLPMCLMAASMAAAGMAWHWSFAPMLLALAPAILTWQLNEFCRRVLYTETRLRAAFANDCISYGGQTLIVGAMWYRDRVTGSGALWALVIATTVGTIVGFWQIRDAFKFELSREAILDNWHFGKWLLGSELLQWVSSLQMYLYLAALILGTGASGTLRAAQILFGPTRVIGYFLQTVLPTRFARALVEQGESAMAAQLRRAIVLVIVGLGPYCILLALFPKWILTTVFDPSYADHPNVLILFSAHAMLSYLAMVVMSALASRRMTRDIFTSCVWGSVIAVALSWPFIKFMGVSGAVACMMTSTIITSAFLVHRYKERNRAEDSSATALSLADEEQACPS